MAKETKGTLVVVEKHFDYSPLEKKTAEQVQSAARRIRQTLKRSIDSIIEVGQELLGVKEALPHGQFGSWLRAEFGWAERTAQNFMSVAERFGPKSAIIADLKIEPTAAYLLAAPSAPDGARQAAVKRAEGGERITPAVAKEILAKARKKAPRKGKALSTEKLGVRLRKALERFRERWNSKEVSELARQLREFADSLEVRGGGRRAKG